MHPTTHPTALCPNGEPQTVPLAELLAHLESTTGAEWLHEFCDSLLSDDADIDGPLTVSVHECEPGLWWVQSFGAPFGDIHASASVRAETTEPAEVARILAPFVRAVVTR